MHCRPHLLLRAVLPLSVLGAGCAHQPRPQPAWIAPQQIVNDRSEPIDLRPYLAADRAGRWVYRRHDLRAGDSRPVEHVRRTGPEWQMEGDDSWQVFRTVDQRLGEQDVRQASYSGLPAALAFRFELAEPLALIPDDLQASSPSVAATRLDYLDVNRKPKLHGTLTRTAVIEGTQDVNVPAGHFADCLQIRVTLHLEMRWGPTIDWTTRVWLSPEAGEVRRVADLSGWLLLFPFGSTFEYELISFTPPAASQPSDVPAPRWKEGFMAFDKGVPSPRLGALVVQFADRGETQLTSSK